MSEPVRLVVATTNKGKIAEFQAMLPAEIELRSLADEGISLPEETGSTFAENAAIKARAAAEQSGLIALADDSGLEVAALDGQPGIRSARYAGEGATDQENVAKLLEALSGQTDENRQARFVCAVAVAEPGGAVNVKTGTREGKIAQTPRGTNGFGYDPVFIIEDGRTVAELTPAEKNATSHRARALAQALPMILGLTGLTKDAGTCHIVESQNRQT
jgi:XTP/dITP diphosphohydrolase